MRTRLPVDKTVPDNPRSFTEPYEYAGGIVYPNVEERQKHYCKPPGTNKFQRTIFYMTDNESALFAEGDIWKCSDCSTSWEAVYWSGSSSLSWRQKKDS